MIFIFSAESALRRGGRGRRQKAGEGRRAQGKGRLVWQRLAAGGVSGGGDGGGGWQSVGGSGADQWHDGGNPGILTL